MTDTDFIKNKVFAALQLEEGQVDARLAASPDELLELDYLEAGIVDSFGLIMLINQLEEDFQVLLDADVITSDEFRRIGGLIDIITGLVRQNADVSASA